MGKYRKKPVVIEAFQWTGDENQIDEPEWIVEAMKEGLAFFVNEGTPQCKMHIKTLESGMSTHVADLNDFIIKGVKGEIYACKPDIFNMTYEQVHESRDPVFRKDVGGKEQWWHYDETWTDTYGPFDNHLVARDECVKYGLQLHNIGVQKDGTLTPVTEQLKQLIMPTWDGNVISKALRDKLVVLGYVVQKEGFNFLTARGVNACRVLGFLTQ